MNQTLWSGEERKWSAAKEALDCLTILLADALENLLKWYRDYVQEKKGNDLLPKKLLTVKQFSLPMPLGNLSKMAQRLWSGEERKWSAAKEALDC